MDAGKDWAFVYAAGLRFHDAEPENCILSYRIINCKDGNLEIDLSAVARGPSAQSGGSTVDPFMMMRGIRNEFLSNNK